MARKRFNADERAILAAGGGTVVEWQNVTQWHAAILVNGVIAADDGWQSTLAVTLNARGTVRAGETVYISPGHLRRPAPLPAREYEAAQAGARQRNLTDPSPSADAADYPDNTGPGYISPD